jgi:hypothetical protein
MLAVLLAIKIAWICWSILLLRADPNIQPYGLLQGTFLCLPLQMRYVGAVVTATPKIRLQTNTKHQLRSRKVVAS